MTNEIIIVKQLPIIEEQLQSIKSQIQDKVVAAQSLECTEATVKTIKSLRTELKKDFEALETKRKEVKKAILLPYEKFEEIYKSCVTEVFRPADREMALKISSVEDLLKAEKESEIKDYFNEYLASKNIDFLSFEDLNIKITLSASKKSLKDQVKGFADKICEDLKMIDTQEFREEILVEYKKIFNASIAILTVKQRHEEIERERQLALEQQEQNEQMAAVAQNVEEILEEIHEEEVKPLFPPTMIPDESVDQEEVVQPTEKATYTTSFNAWGTIEQLKSLKEYMIKEGIRYEQL